MKPKIITTLQCYSGKQFVADGIAGLILAMVAAPRSIAIAIGVGVAVGLALRLRKKDASVEEWQVPDR